MKSDSGVEISACSMKQMKDMRHKMLWCSVKSEQTIPVVRVEISNSNLHWSAVHAIKELPMARTYHYHGEA